MDKRLMVVVIGLGWASVGAFQAINIPMPDLSGAEPQVREKLQLTLQQVVADADDAGAWGRYGMILDAHGFAQEAEDAYRQAHRLDPKERRWPYYLAILLQAAHPQDAVPFFEVALAADANYAPMRIRFARTLEQLGRDDDAWAQYTRAVEIDPRNPFGHSGLGQIALARGQLDVAVGELERAVALDADNGSALSTLAKAYHRRGDSERARETAERARSFAKATYLPDPLHFEVESEGVRLGSYLGRSQAYRNAGRLQDALTELHRALRIAPDDAHVNAALGSLYGKLGDYRSSADFAGRALELMPNIPNVRAMRATALYELGRYGEADRESRRVLDSNEADPDMRYIQGLLLIRRNEFDAALRHLRRAVEIAPGRVGAQLALARTLDRIGRPDAAEKRYRVAVELAPGDAAAWTELGLVRLRLGRFEETTEACRKALAIDADHSAATRALARALDHLNKTADAVECLQTALARAPHDPGLAGDLAWILATSEEQAVRDGKEAVRLAERVVGDPRRRNAATLDTLAAAFAEVGRFDDAVRVMDEVLALARSSNPPGSAVIERYHRRQELYRTQRAYRSPR